MLTKLAIEAIGAFGPLLVGSYLIGLAVFTVMFPWLAISAMRNVKQIRLQFQRLNDRLEARDAAGL